jgi:hypothetical protein
MLGKTTLDATAGAIDVLRDAVDAGCAWLAGVSWTSTRAWPGL